MDRHCLVPNSRVSSAMNRLLNWGPLSLTMVSWVPWCFHTWSLYSCAVCSAVTVVTVGTMCTILVRRHTKTRMQSWPDGVIGRPGIKSILTLSQGPSGVGSGMSRPGGLVLADLCT